MSDPFVKDKLGLAGMLLSRGKQVPLGLHVEGKVDEERASPLPFRAEQMRAGNH